MQSFSLADRNESDDSFERSAPSPALACAQAIAADARGRCRSRHENQPVDSDNPVDIDDFNIKGLDNCSLPRGDFATKLTSIGSQGDSESERIKVPGTRSLSSSGVLIDDVVQTLLSYHQRSATQRIDQPRRHCRTSSSSTVPADSSYATNSAHFQSLLKRGATMQSAEYVAALNALVESVPDLASTSHSQFNTIVQ